MVTNVSSEQLGALAEHLRQRPVRGLDDLYIEQAREVYWRYRRGEIVSCRVLQREGAAARRQGALYSSDGFDRASLSLILGVPARLLPPLRPHQLPPHPDPAGFFEADDGVAEVRWRSSRAAVVRAGIAVEVERPQLVEITTTAGDIHLGVASSPPRTTRALRGTHIPRAGGGRILLAPAASAALFHELVGHPLEADLILSGSSPWGGATGQTILSLPLDIDDDPTETSLPGAFSHDDEGVAASRRRLVRGGVCAGILADRATAATLNQAPGNARRANVHSPPSPRLSNLIVGGAGDDVDALRHDARIEVLSVSAGTLGGTSGIIRLNVRQARAVRRGQGDRMFAPFILQGAFADVALGLLGAGKDPEVATQPGWCGKDGNVVPTGSRAPWVLLQGLEVR